MAFLNKLQILSTINSKIAGILKRSFVSRVAVDKNDFQTAQVSYMGKAVETEMLWLYGTYGSVPLNSLCPTWSVGAQEEDRVTLPARSHDRIKRDLKPGEYGVGNHLTGSTVFFDADGNVVIISKNDLKITVENDADITISGDATIKANNVTIDAKVNLGIGGPAIARVGDSVLVGGDSGVITGGSANHTAT